MKGLGEEFLLLVSFHNIHALERNLSIIVSNSTEHHRARYTDDQDPAWSLPAPWFPWDSPRSSQQMLRWRTSFQKPSWQPWCPHLKGTPKQKGKPKSSNPATLVICLCFCLVFRVNVRIFSFFIFFGSFRFGPILQIHKEFVPTSASRALIASRVAAAISSVTSRLARSGYKSRWFSFSQGLQRSNFPPYSQYSGGRPHTGQSSTSFNAEDILWEIEMRDYGVLWVGCYDAIPV